MSNRWIGNWQPFQNCVGGKGITCCPLTSVMFVRITFVAGLLPFVGICSAGPACGPICTIACSHVVRAACADCCSTRTSSPFWARDPMLGRTMPISWPSLGTWHAPRACISSISNIPYGSPCTTSRSCTLPVPTWSSEISRWSCSECTSNTASRWRGSSICSGSSWAAPFSSFTSGRTYCPNRTSNTDKTPRPASNSSTR